MTAQISEKLLFEGEKELQLGLKATGTETNVIAGPDGQFQLKFKTNAAALEYLNTQKIEPTEVEGFVTLTITAPQKKP